MSEARAKKNKPEFIDRINNPEKYPYISNKDGSVSTHRMSAELDEKTGQWYVFPTIQFDGKKLQVYEDNFKALEKALKTGNFLKMSSKEDAIRYTGGKGEPGEYKTGTPLETFDPLGKKAKTAQTFKEAVE